MSEGEPPGRSSTDAAELGALIGELRATAELLGSQLGELGRASAGAATGVAGDLAAAGRTTAASAVSPDAPAVRRLLELAPPDLRARLTAAATAGLSATRDLADWLLHQVAPEPGRPEPEELPITRLAVPTIPVVTATTWILTASVDNHLATQAQDFSVIGIKERNHARALELEPGDVIVTYLTKAMAFASAVRVTGELFEDRTRIWPGQPGKPDPYPWRVATEPVVVLPQDRWIPAKTLRGELEHVRKWPQEHWTLAFQSQLRAVGDADAALLIDRLQGAVAEPGPA